jgi:hypothetical protein
MDKIALALPAHGALIHRNLTLNKKAIGHKYYAQWPPHPNNHQL